MNAEHQLRTQTQNMRAWTRILSQDLVLRARAKSLSVGLNRILTFKYSRQKLEMFTVNRRNCTLIVAVKWFKVLLNLPTLTTFLDLKVCAKR